MSSLSNIQFADRNSIVGAGSRSDRSGIEEFDGLASQGGNKMEFIF